MGSVSRLSTRGLILTFLLQVGFINVVRSQPLDYKTIFGSDWQKAESFISENRSWIEPELNKFNVPYAIAIAVIFPELVRYSALMDKMEITLLKTLYINLGDEYADFSIGHFQMKPSFAEKIREYAIKGMGRRSKELFRSKSEYSETRLFRSSIVDDLENPKAQLNYLIAFFKICESRFNLRQRDEFDKVRFIATAYNYGFFRSAEKIDSMKEKRFFTSRLFSSDNYSYSDISVFWYSAFIKNNPGYNSAIIKKSR
jgi:hypothetical protein